MGLLLEELKHCIKALGRHSIFSVVFVGMLALSVGGVVSIFTIADAVLFRALPYPESGRLEILHWLSSAGKSSNLVSAQLFFFLRERANSLGPMAVAGAASNGSNLASTPAPQYVKILQVSSDYFHVLGVEPDVGRSFLADEDRPGAPNVAVLSHALWQTTFAKAGDVLRKQVRIGSKSYQVVGIMPKSFESYPAADLWLPLQLTPQAEGNNFLLLARRKSEFSFQQSTDELKRLSPEFLKAFPPKSRTGDLFLSMESYRDYLVSGSRTGLLELLSAMVFVLAIAYANLCTLFVSRSSVYDRDLAVRAALGAPGRRLIRLILTDSFMPVAFGTGIGIVLARLLIPFFLLLAPHDLPRSGEIHLGLDGFLLAFALAVTGSLSFALIPVIRVRRLDIQSVLKQGYLGRRVGLFNVSQILLTGETAVSFVLLTTAVLLVGSFIGVHSVSLGFIPDHAYIAQISLANQRYQTADALSRFTNGVLARMQTVSGVEHAAAASGLPFESGLNVPMHPVGNKELGIDAGEYRAITPDYFQAMGIELRGGRAFTERDNGNGAQVVIVNETLARQWWSGRSCLGQQIIVADGLPGLSDKTREIVGVVADVHEAGLDRSPPPTVFVPQSQQPDAYAAITNGTFFLTFVIRTSRQINVGELARSAVRSVNPELPIATLCPAKDLVQASLASFRFYAWLTGVLAGFAMLLTFVGLYGLLSYQVSRRSREIGMRMALGAQKRNILVSVLQEALTVVGTGAVIGTIAALTITPFLSSLLYGIQQHNLLMYLALIGIFLLIAGIAAWEPAHRAADIDPNAILRIE